MTMPYARVDEIIDQVLEYKVQIVSWYEPEDWTLLVTDMHGNWHNLMTHPDKAEVEKMETALVQAFHRGLLVANKRWISEVAPDY